MRIIMSPSLLWRHIVLLTVGVFQATTECYIPLESVWREDFKKVYVRPFVCLFVTLTKKAYTFFIMNSRIIIRFQMKGFGILYKKMKQYFQKNIFQKF